MEGARWRPFQSVTGFWLRTPELCGREFGESLTVATAGVRPRVGELAAWGCCPVARPASLCRAPASLAPPRSAGPTPAPPDPPLPPGGSLVELRGPAQSLPHFGRQVPGVLRRVPAQLLAFGVVHVADVVQRPGLSDLWEAQGAWGTSEVPRVAMCLSPGLLSQAEEWDGGAQLCSFPAASGLVTVTRPSMLTLKPTNSAPGPQGAE